MKASILLVLIPVALACNGAPKNAARQTHDSLTERQRDSALAKSGIPGASAVGKAMRVADSTSAEIRATDSIGQ